MFPPNLIEMVANFNFGKSEQTSYHTINSIFSVSWTLILTLLAVGSVALVLCLICYCFKGRHGNNGKAKRRPLGIKRAGYFRVSAHENYVNKIQYLDWTFSILRKLFKRLLLIAVGIATTPANG
jgi:hypothetical protein